MAKLLIIIPAYNEEDAISATVADLQTIKDVTFDIVIINDGSVDSTRQVAVELSNRHANVNLVNLPLNSGIGSAVQTGFLFAYKQTS